MQFCGGVTGVVSIVNKMREKQTEIVFSMSRGEWNGKNHIRLPMKTNVGKIWKERTCGISRQVEVRTIVADLN